MNDDFCPYWFLILPHSSWKWVSFSNPDWVPLPNPEKETLGVQIGSFVSRGGHMLPITLFKKVYNGTHNLAVIRNRENVEFRVYGDGTAWCKSPSIDFSPSERRRMCEYFQRCRAALVIYANKRRLQLYTSKDEEKL